MKRSWQKDHGEDISAITNAESISKGWIVVGVGDDGTLAGHDLKWLKQNEEKISQHVRQFLEPSWVVKTIEEVEIGGLQCIFIEVESSPSVVRWNGSAYYLAGTTSYKMREDEVLALSPRLPGSDFSKGKYSKDINVKGCPIFLQYPRSSAS